MNSRRSSNELPIDSSAEVGALRQSSQKSKFGEFSRKYASSNEALKYDQAMEAHQNLLITKLETDFIIRMSKRLLTSSSASYLDVATGTGRIIAGIEKESSMVMGLDPSRAMIKLATKNTRYASFVVGDGSNIPFRDSSFELITCFRLLINLAREQRFKFLSECRRVLTRNGLLIADLHANKMSPTGIAGTIRTRLGWSKARDFGRYDLLTRPRMAREMQTAGLMPCGVLSTYLPTIFKFLRGRNSHVMTLADMRISQMFGMFADVIVMAALKQGPRDHSEMSA